MKLVVGPVDVVGNLWVIRAGDAPWAPVPEDVWLRTRSSVELRVSKRVGVEAAVASALCAGRSVSLFEHARVFAGRIDRLSQRLAELGVAAEWSWTESTMSTDRIDEERHALAWFLRHWAELLFVDPVGFEKRRHTTPTSPPRV